MKEYRYESYTNRITVSINEAAKDGWRVVAYSASNFLGSSANYDVIFERDQDWHKDADLITEYQIVTTSGRILAQIESYALKGWNFVSFSNLTFLGSSGKYDLVFERTIKIQYPLPSQTK